MGLQDVGVRLVAENEAQFQAALKGANKAVDNFGKGATKSVKTFNSRWDNLVATVSSPKFRAFAIGAATAVGGAMLTLGKTAKSLADDYMNYAFQVKDFGRIIGATPEEASKLIQVADDVRLSVGSMQTALRSAIMKGYTPTVEGLGQMSDAYLSIQDPIARSKFLIETFGRSGLEMAKLMEVGSSKIKEMGDSIEGTGRLMTQAGIDAATEYYKALDRLGESWENLTLTIGLSATPVITKAANEMSGMAEAIPALSQMIAVLDSAEKANVITVKDQLYYFGQYMQGLMTAPQIVSLFEGRVNATTTSLRSVNAATTIADYSLQMLTRTTGDLTAKTWETSDAYKTMIAGIQKVGAQKVTIGLDFTFPNVADKMKNLMDSIDWQAAGGGALEEFMVGFAEKVAGFAPEVQKEMAAEVGAVDIALEVKTGEIKNWEGIQQIKDLYVELGKPIDTKGAQDLIDKVNGMDPPDISAYLDSIVGLVQPSEDAAVNTEELGKKVQGLGMSITEHGGKVVTLSDNMLILEENARLAYAAVRDLSGAIRSIPTTPLPGQPGGGNSGAGGGGGGGTNKTMASGGPVGAGVVYLVGERGPELFMPDTAGRIIPNGKTMSLLDNFFKLVPMAKGGKVTPEKAHMQALKKRWEAMHYNPNEEHSGGGGEEEGGGDIERQASEAVSALRAREDFAWSDLRFSVAEYNAMVRSGASKQSLAEKKQTIDRLQREAQALTTLRTDAERQASMLNVGITEGFENSSTWLQALIGQFQSFFALLTSATAKNAMNTIDPLTAHSPAPLALGLKQIGAQMNQLDLSGLFGNVAQLARPGGGGGSYSSVYNINVPISATVGNQVDVKVLAYAVAKEIAANVRY